MMDWSSVIYAGLVVGGAIAVLMMVSWILSAESSTVSISRSPVRTASHHIDLPSLPEAA
jgi:hypothetical protein